MPFHDFVPNVVNNPLVQSVFTQNFSEHGDFPPPGSNFLITDGGDNLMTDDGNNLITD